MDIQNIFKRILPSWTLLNLILTVLSIVSAILLYVTQTLFPSTQGLLEFTVVSLVNAIFIFYWTFWFILTVPPIAGALYLSRKEPDYYRFAVQNVAAVVVLYLVKLVFDFNILELAV